MLALFAASTALAEVLPSFAELKQLYQKILSPQLQDIPVWGLAVMAVGAGVGEETFFRGFLQTWLTDTTSSVGTGILGASVVFGALHAATPSYFVFATAAGVIFGAEYVVVGLPEAAFTHALYDFFAFIAILQLWGHRNTSQEKEM